MEKLAIIGTGIAGMGCAHFLQKDYDITLFDKKNYVGGHTNTVDVKEDSKNIPIDTGFMVFNPINYPNLIQLFKDLDVPVKHTDMSFSVQHKPSGLEYSGSGLDGLFAQRKNIFSIKHIHMLMEINRFNTESVADLKIPEYKNYSLARYMKANNYGNDILEKYLLPMSSALWSTPPDVTMQFPAVALIRFFKNHGFLGLNTQHKWLTVDGGSKEYRKRLIAPFKHKIFTESKVVSAENIGNKTLLKTETDSFEFDKVIFACHADSALEIIKDPTFEQQRLLSKYQYQRNIATLHTDTSIMPKTKKAWSSWNYRLDKKNNKLNPSCIYYMNTLQGVSDKEDYFVSINDGGNVNPDKIIKDILYYHPVFTVDGMLAQKELPTLNENDNTFFCGSYFRYGFHEDAFTSAVGLCKIILGEHHPSLKKFTSPLHSKDNASIW